MLFRSSRHGIERLELCDSKEDLKNSKIVTLENCVKITQEPQEHLITIVTKTGSFQLSTQTDEDLTNWVTALKSVAFKDKNHVVNRTSAIEEDNDLYCSSYSDGEFTVKLIQTDTTIRCNLDPGTYLLELAKTELQLRRPTIDMGIVAKWPYRYIRKYGYRDGKFTFEAGRKCDTGEGVFCLDHQNPQQIFRCMAAKMKTMKNLIKGDNLTNSDCGTGSENHLNAAISMEAGSRSPIPLSAQSSINHNLSDFDSSILSLNLNQCSASNRGFISSNDSLNATTPTSGAGKTIPSKPPRNTINTRGKFQNYEPVTPTSPTSTKSFLKSITDGHLSQNSSSSNLSLNIPPPPNRDYECIETRTDAWKTFGIGEVKHTEHVTTPEDDLIQFVWQRSQKDVKATTNGVATNTETTKNISPQTSPASKSNLNNNSSNSINNNNNLNNTKSSPPPPPPHKLVMEKVEATEGDYDRLDFFGTNSKLCSTYTTIITVVPPAFRKQISQPISSNDYELIGGPDISSCRLADDSYLGYGVLRKPSGSTSKTLLNEEGLLDHRQCNGLDYAIVSKPKRV